jgi:hypothetical protein
MKRLTVMVERDEDALAIVQLLMQGANKAVDFRLETVSNGETEHAHHRRPRVQRHLENSGLIRAWETAKNLTGEFTVNEIRPVAIQHGMSAMSASTLVSRWFKDGLIVKTGAYRGRAAVYAVKH